MPRLPAAVAAVAAHWISPTPTSRSAERTCSSGNFHGFQTYDIERTNKPRLLASVVCPGGQGDMSIYGNLLFMSVEQTRGRIDCGIGGVAPPSSAERFRGVRIFDIKDLSNPKQVAAVQTCRGSHTHTLVGCRRTGRTSTSTARAPDRSGRARS